MKKSMMLVLSLCTLALGIPAHALEFGYDYSCKATDGSQVRITLTSTYAQYVGKHIFLYDASAQALDSQVIFTAYKPDADLPAQTLMVDKALTALQTDENDARLDGPMNPTGVQTGSILVITKTDAGTTGVQYECTKLP